MAVEANKMTVHRVEFNYMAEYPFVEYIVHRPSVVMHHFQSTVIGHVRGRLAKTRDINERILICGPTGGGKSTVARLLQNSIEGSVLLENVDLLKRDLLPHKHIFGIRTASTTCLIVLINEIDRALEYAHQSDPAIEFNCIAQSKSSLNNFMDLIRDIPETVVIMTSNVPLASLREMYPSSVNTSRVTLAIDL
jgi:predicted AAA+ superfamily ATPase